MAISKYIPSSPSLTLETGAVTATGKDLYNLNDGSGLSSDYRTYNFSISSLTPLDTNDNNIGQYNGTDVKPGDFFSLVDGTKTWKIISISSQTNLTITGVLEDINMGIARTYPNTTNNPNGASGIIYRVNENNYPLISINYSQQLNVNNAIDRIVSYLQIFNNNDLFVFSPQSTGSLELGDLVTATGSGAGYNLITASLGDTIIGTVYDSYGNNVVVRPYNKIITEFESPEKVQDGIVGSIWYESGSGQITTSSADNRSSKFFQISLAQGATTTGTVDNPTFDETSYNFIINDVEVIAQNPGGSSALPIGDITQSVNNTTDQHYVTAGINEIGGNAEINTGDSAGSGGENGTLKFSGVGNGIVLVVGSSTTLPFSNPSAPGKFAITASSGYELEIHPTDANQILSGLAYADEFQIASDINAEAIAQGAPIQATATTGNIEITATDGSDITINKISPYTSPSTTDCVGLNSGTGLPTGLFNAPPTEYYLTLSRTDGGKIQLEGSFITTSGQSAGLNSAIGQAPYLLMLEGGSLTASGSGADDDWYIGDTFLTASKDVQITGSLLVNRQDSTADFFLIRSGSYDALKVDSQGITRFFAHEDEATPWATADYGGLYYMSSSVWVAID